MPAQLVTPTTRTTAGRTVGAVAAEYGIARSTVRTAIADGRLPALRIPMGKRCLWVVRPADAEALWGRRLHQPTPPPDFAEVV